MNHQTLAPTPTPTMLRPLSVQALTPDLLPDAVMLDHLCFGGLWSVDGYRREMDNPNSDLIVLRLESGSSELVPPPSSEPAFEQILDLPLLSATDQGVIGLGCCWFILEEAHVILLAVHPGQRRQGFGQLLLHALLCRAHQRQSEWATLEVRISNDPAIALYQQFGFEEVGRRRRYYQDTDEDGLILWKRGLQEQEFVDHLQHWRQKIGDRLLQNGWDWSEEKIRET